MGDGEKKEKKDKKEDKDKKEEAEKPKEEVKPKKRIENSGDGMDLWSSTAGGPVNQYSSKPKEPQDKRDKQKKIEEDTKKDAAAGKSLMGANDMLKSMLKENKAEEQAKIKERKDAEKKD